MEEEGVQKTNRNNVIVKVWCLLSHGGWEQHHCTGWVLTFPKGCSIRVQGERLSFHMATAPLLIRSRDKSNLQLLPVWGPGSRNSRRGRGFGRKGGASGRRSRAGAASPSQLFSAAQATPPGSPAAL